MRSLVLHSEPKEKKQRYRNLKGERFPTQTTLHPPRGTLTHGDVRKTVPTSGCVASSGSSRALVFPKASFMDWILDRFFSVFFFFFVIYF